MGLALSILFVFLIFPLFYGYSINGASGILAVVLVFAWFGIPTLIGQLTSFNVALVLYSIECVVMLVYCIYCHMNK